LYAIPTAIVEIEVIDMRKKDTLGKGQRDTRRVPMGFTPAGLCP
jgi:hypothetical protein